jgi:hypothetical protein
LTSKENKTMPNPFSQKELEALDLQWRSNEIEKIDAA